MKLDNLDWRDVRVKDALTAFMRLKALIEEQGSKIERLYIHPRLVARGYVFAVDYNGKKYGFMNAYDFDEAIAGLPNFNAEDFEGHVLGVPVTEDTEETLHKMGGVFFHVSQVGLKRYK